MNNYRVNGGGGAPHVTDAPIVWDSLLENRSLLIEWVQAETVVDPADFHTVDWRLTADGIEATPTFIIGGEKVPNQSWDSMRSLIQAKLDEVQPEAASADAPAN